MYKVRVCYNVLMLVSDIHVDEDLQQLEKVLKSRLKAVNKSMKEQKSVLDKEDFLPSSSKSSTSNEGKVTGYFSKKCIYSLRNTTHSLVLNCFRFLTESQFYK